MANGMSSRALARERRAREEGHALKEYLSFRLDRELYAIDIRLVGEILRITPITVVPRAPRSVMGIIGVRGRVLSVLDLRRNLRLGCPEPTRHARILVFPLPDRDEVGLYVDEVRQVVRLADEDIEPATAALGTSAGEHVMGVGRQRGEPIVILRLEALLQLQEHDR